MSFARIAACLLATCLVVPAAMAFGPADRETDWALGGHGKFQYVHTRLPEDSILQEVGGDRLEDYNLEVRLKAAARRGRWGFKTHFQFITVHSDTLSVSDGLPLMVFPGAGIINDDRRWYDLTHVFHNEGRNATLARLDRVSIGYTGDSTVVRFGRQAISWGNGLLYTPMDIFNPFDPTTVDKEYKSGDDMIYGQYLLAGGNDIQAVAVVRRDPFTGGVEADQSSLAVKYHGFLGSGEFDVLLSEHYDDPVFGLGGSVDAGGAVWRGDLVLTDTDEKSVITGVGGVMYSWMGGGRNWTGALEYYYNGFGQPGGDYSVAELAGNDELLQRLARGESFNLGRHYLGASVTVEVTPLLTISPNAFINLTDPSALAQVVLSYNWKQDIQVLGALNIPLGSSGSEFGGVEALQPGLYVSTGTSLFAQLAWYF